MNHKVPVFVLVVLIAVGLAFAGAPKAEKKVVASDLVSAAQSNNGAPIVPAAFNPRKINAAETIIGTTYYDYFWNSGSPRHVEFYDGITYLLYIGRDGAATARFAAYVSYNGTTFTAPQAAVDPATQACYFSGIDVWRGGAADKYCGVASGWVGAGNSYYALEAGPGQGNFTANIATTNRDVQVTNLDDQGSLLYYHSAGRLNYAHRYSTDFGTTFVDANTDLLQYCPGGQAQGALEPPQVFQNGTMYLFSAAAGTDKIPPVGEAPPDSSDILGYWTSTDNGTNWAYTKLLSDGIEYAPSHFSLFANFDQYDMLVDNTNKLRFVTNGYNLYRYTTTPSDSFRASMDAVYWDATNGFKSLVNFDRTLPILVDVIARRGGGGVGSNRLGCSYPSIATSPDGQVIVCTWSQPNFTETTIDTNSNGYVTSNITYNASFNGGATWGTPVKLTTATGVVEEFSNLAEDLEQVSPGVWKARVLFLRIETGTIGDGTDPEDAVYSEFTVSATDVRENGSLPAKFALDQNYPNPFNPSTRISYSIPTGSDVKLSVFNVLGQEVATLVEGYRAAGTYNADFSASNLPSGVYFYTISAGNFSDSKKMVLMK